MRKLLQDRSGSVAVMTAVALTTLLLFIGVGVDFGRSFSGRTNLQAALDAAVIAGVKSPIETQDAVALAALTTNLSTSGMTVDSADWTRNADGSFSGAATASVATTFLKVFQRPGIAVSAASTASKSAVPSEVTFRLDAAQGWAWKQVTLWAHSVGAASDTLVATFTYQPVSIPAASGTVSGPIGQPIPLGSNYDYAYLRMEVSFDGCGVGFAPKYPNAIAQGDMAHLNPYECIPVSATAVKTTPVQSYSTNDPATAYHLFVDGKQLTTATAISSIIVCGKSTSTAWEDADDPDPTGPQWSQQDIFFTVDATTCGQNVNLPSPLKIVH